VDFKDIQNATDALVNPRNHSLNGRALVVEYASADAVRRGQIAKQPVNMNPKSRASRRPQKSERIAAKLARSDVGTPSVEKDPGGQENDPSIDTNTRKSAPGLKLGPKIAARSKTPRPKPGASLKNAQREKVAIVESTGKKITFDT
jgi:RNA recognition motif-containing protein